MAEPADEDPRCADVAVPRVELLVARSLLDLRAVVLAQAPPRDARRAPVVERDLLVRLSVGE